MGDSGREFQVYSLITEVVSLTAFDVIYLSPQRLFALHSSVMNQMEVDSVV